LPDENPRMILSRPPSAIPPKFVSPQLSSMLSRNRFPAPSSRGFSLVELLVVMAILVVMLALAGPAMNALKGANDVNQAAADLSGILEQARAYAMANNTFTYVGLHQVTGTDSSVKFAVFASKDGTRTIANNLQQISRLKTIENAQLTEKIEDYPNNKRPMASSGNTVENILTANSGITLPSTGSGDSQVKFDHAIRFGPSGLAQADDLTPTSADNPKGYYEFGLYQTRGSKPLTDNSAVVQVSGLTGSVQVYRPTVK
jgi:prepilin-type N-terminal cleavage/methylation domain-containing protein